MALANGWLLLGALFIAVPIVLHLVMRRKPKHLVFPALQFVKRRRESNRRKLQFRHLLLLILRCLGILLLALALARPSVVSALVGNWMIIGALAGALLIVILLAVLSWLQSNPMPLTGGLSGLALFLTIMLLLLSWNTLRYGAVYQIGDREAPVAAVLVVDTSPRMEYRQANQTRLEKAQSIAAWVVEQLPDDSDVAIADSRRRDPVDQVDIASAKKALERLHSTAVNDPLVTVVDRSLRKIRDSNKLRKEIYVFTDMTQAAWNDTRAELLKQELKKHRDVSVYVIDVGAEDPQNLALGNLELSAESQPKNGVLRVRTALQQLGPAVTKTVRLQLEKPDLRRPVIRDGKMLVPEERWERVANVEVEENKSAPVELTLSGLELGVHQGFVEIVGEDSLPIDDRRYFTIEVKEAWRVLVASPPGTVTKFFTEAIAPYSHRERGDARFQCTTIQQNDLTNQTLGDFAAVCLLNPEPITPQTWEQLTAFVEAGGSLAIFLGHNARANLSFNGEEAQKLLPGPLDSLVGRGGPSLYFSSSDISHPVMAVFRPMATNVPWYDFPIYKYWVFEQRAPRTSVVLRYNNNRPAIVERSVGRGRVLTMTTPVSEPALPSDRSRWNDLVLGNAWPYVVLVNEMMSYLVSSGDTRLNYLVGQTVVLPNSKDSYPQEYELFTPVGTRHEKGARDDKVVFTSTKIPGAYRLKGRRGDLPIVRGFCANLPLEASDLTPMDAKKLDEILGEERYQLARDTNEIDRQQGVTRVGREFYPFLIALLALVLGLEAILANRFYKKSE